MYTNTRIADSVVTNEDYAKRAKELGHGIISTMEHGWQGRYIEGYELAEKYGLTFVFGTEAYWVRDRTEQDNSNCHICIFARNENGRQAINDILSEANISGYYVRPRIDCELIFSLPPKDVIITSACVAFWKYDDSDDMVERLHDYFGKNFFLEVQYHNTEKQRELNRHILELSNEWNIPIIMGCDSHYISEEQAWERTDFLLSKGIEYPDEAGWYMDYPSGEEAYRRFADPCVLSHEQILEAMNNTNVFLEVEKYDSPIFNHEVKLPTIYPDKSQEENSNILSDASYKPVVDDAIRYNIFDYLMEKIKGDKRLLLNKVNNKIKLSPEEEVSHKQYISYINWLKQRYLPDKKDQNEPISLCDNTLIQILSFPILSVENVNFGNIDYFIELMLFSSDNYWNAGNQKDYNSFAAAINKYLNHVINKQIFGNLQAEITDKEIQEILSLTLPIVKHKNYWDEKDPVRTILYKDQDYISLHNWFEQDVHKFKFLFKRYMALFL